MFFQFNDTDGLDPGGIFTLPPEMMLVITQVIIILVVLVVGIFMLKLGLVVVKAEKRNLKSVAFYYIFLMGTIFIINIQMLFIPGGGAFFLVLIFFISLSMFISTNMINIIYELGIKKAIVVSVFIVVPITIAMSFIFSQISGAFGDPSGSNGSTGTSILLIQCLL